MDDAAPPADGPLPAAELSAEADPPGRRDLGAGDPEQPEAGSVPPVVAVVVTRDPGPWFEEVLEALGDSDYPELTVLVLDAGSAEDPTGRVAAPLPAAFVRRLPENVGFAVAANEALSAVTGATFLCFMHDDVVPDPAAIRLLVEEGYRSNSAILGPKLVDYDRPEVLLEVGCSIDRFAVPHSRVEPGEIDQEQHDAVRDVFYVSDAMMLVRADLFSELGGFDARTFPGGEDLDLCWRAGLAGARVMVVPDARARHRKADHLRDDADRASKEQLHQSRLRALLKCYSGLSLCYLIPLTLLLNVVEAVAFLFTRRRDRARALLGAWVWNARNLGDLRQARAAAQALRSVPDSEVRVLQSHGSARVRHFLVGSLHAEERIRTISERGRTVADSASSGARTPQVMLVGAFALVLLLGSRGLLLGRVSAVGQLATWPGVGDLLGAFTSAWRASGLGSPSAPPPLLAAFAGLGTAVVGATALARTLLVVAALPVGVFGAWQLGRRIAGPGWPAAAAALVYGVNPVARNALAAGRFGPVVLYMLAPFVLGGLLRLAGYLPDEPRRRRWRSRIGTAALVAVTAAAWPPALAFPVLVLVAFAFAAPLARDGFARVRALGAAAFVSVGLALALLLPWPLTYLQAGDRLAVAGFAFRPFSGLSELVRFDTGPNGAGTFGWSFVVAAGVVLLLAAEDRLAWTARLWVLALVSFAVPFLSYRFLPDTPMPAVEGLLVPAALALALVVGVGVAAFAQDVLAVHFGWRQIASLVGVVTLAGAGLLFVGDSLGGRWHQPDDDWVESLSWMHAQEGNGRFRVLWLGDASILPVDPLPRGDVAYGVTDNGPGDARMALPPPPGGASALVGEAVDLLVSLRSDRVGRLLAPMAVRYVALPDRADPGDRPTAPPSAALRAGLAAQLDFVRLEAPAGITLYENRAYLPGAALLPDDPTTKGPLDVLDAPDAWAAVPVLGGPVPEGTVLWSQAYDGAWKADGNGDALTHRRAFGWANGFAHPDKGTVTISYGRQWTRYPLVLLQLAIVVGAFGLWRGSLRFRRRGRAASYADRSGGEA
ncbi:MAG: glycosyltransferase [Actinobacteria bacterium]|nr:glycosyltransferase [Actinomycetota bacterium]